MNKTQKILLWVATSVLALMLIWPPWIAIKQPQFADTPAYRFPHGYHFITDDQQHLASPSAWSLNIEWQRYLPPLVAVVIISVVAVASAATKSP